MYTLLVIDMQEQFLNRFVDPEEQEDVIEHCRRAVTKAMADGAEILDVNYKSNERCTYGPTVPEIKNLWQRYQKFFPDKVKTVLKENDGGGDEVMEAKPQYDHMLACGINAGACVQQTVKELAKYHCVNVKVIAEAVANCWGGKTRDLAYFRDNSMLTNFSWA